MLHGHASLTPPRSPVTCPPSIFITRARVMADHCGLLVHGAHRFSELLSEQTVHAEKTGGMGLTPPMSPVIDPTDRPIDPTDPPRPHRSIISMCRSTDQPVMTPDVSGESSALFK